MRRSQIRPMAISRRALIRAGASLGALALAAGIALPAAAQDGPIRLGVLSDMSGMVVDLSGPGTVEAVEMAVEDFGGEVLGRPVEVLVGDHLNKPDVGIGLARKWYDEGVGAIFDVGITSVALGVQDLARQRDKIVMFISSATADLTGKACSPNGIHWNYNSNSQAVGVIRSFIEEGQKSFYFLTVDYAYGHTVQADTTKMIEALGGTVVGATPHSFETTDFSSDLLKAQSSGAEVIALATTSVHIPNIIKQADEFGVRPGQPVAPLSLTLHDVKAMGLPTAQGVLETSTFYWDQNDETRAFAERFHERFGRMPNMIQASAYGAAKHYLEAIAAAGTDETQAVLAKMHETPVNDFMTKGARVRPDGQVMREQIILRAKTPDASTGEWDLYEVIGSVPAEEAYLPPNPDACPIAG